MRSTNVELSYILLYVITCVISLLQALGSDCFPGELARYSRLISDLEVIILSIFNILSFIIAYIIYISFSTKSILVHKKWKVIFNEKKAHNIFLVILVMQIFFLLYTGVGKVSISGVVNTHPLSPVFAILKPDTFALIYYVLCRSKYKLSSGSKLFFLNIGLFCIFKLLQGWTGFFLHFFVLEMYCRQREMKGVSQRIKRRLISIFFFPIVVIILGGAVYQHLYVIKNEIRGNNVKEITYMEGVKHLSSRLSMNPNSLGAYQNLDKIVDLARAENTPLKEGKSILRPIVPSSWMEKEFRNLNNSVMHSYTHDLISGTSSDFGIIMYTTTLINSDVTDFVLYCILVVVFVFVSKVYFDTLSNGDGTLNIVFFLLLFKLVYTASLEATFGHGFFSNIYSFMVFMMFGGFVIQKKEI